MGKSSPARAAATTRRACGRTSASCRPRRDLFQRHGFRGVGVDAIAEAAGTNKMTLYRHFSSKDELIVACLREAAAEDMDAAWSRIEAAASGGSAGAATCLGRFGADCVLSEDRGMRTGQRGGRVGRGGSSGASADRRLQDRASRAPGRAMPGRRCRISRTFSPTRCGCCWKGRASAARARLRRAKREICANE